MRKTLAALVVALGHLLGHLARNARAYLTTCAELAGLAAIAVGAGMIFLPAGVIVAGVGLVLVGYLEGRSS